jgi:1,4-alpha-glucan branching enzyme
MVAARVMFRRLTFGGSKQVKREQVAKSNKWSVTFEMPAEINAEELAVVGDFNDWDAIEGQMKRRKDGSWAKTIRLAPGTYRFRYVAGGGIWYNDPAADTYEPSGFGQDNSVVVLAE